MRLYLIILTTILLGTVAPAQAKDKYAIDHAWAKDVTAYGLGQTTGVGVDSHNHLFVFHRASLGGDPSTTFIAEDTVLMLDGDSGEILKTWGANLFLKPHGLSIDADDNVWLTDVVAHTVQKFSHDGEHLMTLGTHGEPGDDATHFNRPADISFATNGDIFIADGYVNTRVAKYSSDGSYLMSWGKPGEGEGEFNLVHGIAVSSDGTVYVADRTNSRLQIFDTSGTFKKIIKREQVGRPFAIAIDETGKILIIDGGDPPEYGHAQIVELDGKGKAKVRFDTNHDQQAKTLGHDIAVGADGALYVADVYAKRVQKIVKSAGK